MHRSFATLIVAFSTVFTAACAAPPKAELDAAASALESASATADYAPEAFEAAQAANQALQTELATQEGKLALFRSYDQSRTLATAAQTAADEASRAGQDEKRRVREETAALIADAKAVLEEATTLFAQAPRGKGTEADLAALQGDLDLVSTDLVAAEEQLGLERYREARTHADGAYQTAMRVKTSIEQAILATGRPRG